MVQNCDILILTGIDPVPDFILSRHVSRVPVIHSGLGCVRTEGYAAPAAQYDELVAVSKRALVLPEEHRDRPE